MALVLTVTPVRLKLTPQPDTVFDGLDLRFTVTQYAKDGPYRIDLPSGWSFSRTGAGTALRD